MESTPQRLSKPRIVRFWREQVRPTAVLVLVLISFRSAIADWNVVPTGSMKPTIMEGDRIFVNKIAYDLKVPFTNWHLLQWSDPKRGDIVVFDSPKDGVRLVKRAVAVPGDTVQMIDNNLIINGTAAQYGPLDQATVDQLLAAEQPKHTYSTETVDKVHHAMMLTPELNAVARTSFGPIVVPPGEYFMLGDNRDNSADSRYIGFVPRANIIGRSGRVLISLNYDHYYLPRWNRLFKSLP